MSWETLVISGSVNGLNQAFRSLIEKGLSPRSQQRCSKILSDLQGIMSDLSSPDRDAEALRLAEESSAASGWIESTRGRITILERERSAGG